MPHRVVLYSKEGCCLCDRARQDLLRLGDEFPFQLEEVDITGDAALYQRYKNAIPVIVINDHSTLALRIDEARLRRAFERENSKQKAES